MIIKHGLPTYVGGKVAEAGTARLWMRCAAAMCAFLSPCDAVAQDSLNSPDKPNVLFIAIDDLRPELGCYQQPHIKSPNIERLAKRGLIFDRTYCQQAICMSSRASLLSGYRPDKGQIYMNGPLFTHVPDVLTLNQYFLNNGYTTVCMGKIYHH